MKKQTLTSKWFKKIMAVLLAFVMVLPSMAVLESVGINSAITSYAATKKLAAPTKYAVAAISTSAINVTFKKVSGASGYQLQYSTSKKFTAKTTKSVTVKASKNVILSKKISKLKSNKRYYVRVRAYKTVKNKKSYGKFTSTKSAVTFKVIKAPAHTKHTYIKTVVPPTCATNGYTIYTCSVCGYTTTGDYTTAAHVFSQYVSDNNATCTTDGTKTARCYICGATNTVVDPGTALGHKYTMNVVPTSCSAQGYTRYTCSRCGYYYDTMFVPTVAHAFLSKELVKPTCTEQGYTAIKCITCGYSYNTSFVPAKGHAFTDATCTAPKKCNVCGITEGAALGHNFGANEKVCLNGCGTQNPNYVDPSNKVTVTFDSNGGAEVEPIFITSGATITAPETSREGYNFDGWFYAGAMFDFSTPITENITLTAKWSRQYVDDSRDDSVIDLGDLQDLTERGIIEVEYNDSGDVSVIDGQFTNQKIHNEADAANVLNNAKSIFDISSNGSFNAKAEDIADRDSDLENVYCYSPEVDGLKVVGSQIIVTADDNGNATGLYSTYNNSISNVSTSPAYSATEAREIAVSKIAEKYGISYSDINSSTPELVVYASGGVTPVLVYQISLTNVSTSEDEEDYSATNTNIEIGEIPTIDGSSSSEETSAQTVDCTCYVRADDGDIYLIIDNEEGWENITAKGKDGKNRIRVLNVQRNGSNYRLVDSKRNIYTYKTFYLLGIPMLPGTIAKGESIEGAAISLHANMEASYDFYHDTLNRNSYDDKGRKIRASYDYAKFGESSYKNAFWSGSKDRFVFGKGFLYQDALDIVGHEFTHAVTQYVNDLEYKGETGALNESYSDIMGMLIENKTGSAKWTLGEDSHAISRSFSNPALYDQATHYDNLSDPDWSERLNRYKDRDNEGVHIFSGVFNKAAYLMMTDSRTSDMTTAQWARIFYYSMYRLTSDAKFLDARLAIVNVARELGYNSDHQEAIKDAFDAVGICEKDAIRIILKWGETPRDLDSHLVGPTVDGAGTFHTWYRNSSKAYYDENENIIADLDYDDTTSYGPEITTIHVLTPGEYNFYVFDYTNRDETSSTELAGSEATVTVYRNNKLIKKYAVDQTKNATVWHVFRMNVNESKRVTYTTINQYGYKNDYNVQFTA